MADKRASVERVFRSHFPDAEIDSQPRAYPRRGRVYWIYRRGAHATSLGEGTTAAQAWADACAQHGITELKEP